MNDSSRPTPPTVDPEIAELGIERLESVFAHGGRLEIICFFADGRWTMVAAWGQREYAMVEPIGSM